MEHFFRPRYRKATPALERPRCNEVHSIKEDTWRAQLNYLTPVALSLWSDSYGPAEWRHGTAYWIASEIVASSSINILSTSGCRLDVERNREVWH